MNLRISARARREARRIDERWRAQADRRQLFVEEFEVALTQIRAEPNIGTPYDAAASVPVRRTRLPKTDYFVYYTVQAEEIVLLALWSARRGAAAEAVAIAFVDHAAARELPRHDAVDLVRARPARSAARARRPPAALAPQPANSSSSVAAKRMRSVQRSRLASSAASRQARAVSLSAPKRKQISFASVRRRPSALSSS